MTDLTTCEEVVRALSDADLLARFFEQYEDPECEARVEIAAAEMERRNLDF